MLPKLMGAAVFSVGFFMLLVGTLYLLGSGNLAYDTGRTIFIFFGGIVLCLIGYFMARRLPRVETGPQQVVTTTTEIQQEPPPEHF
jgi:Na+/proline symporter